MGGYSNIDLSTFLRQYIDTSICDQYIDIESIFRYSPNSVPTSTISQRKKEKKGKKRKKKEKCDRSSYTYYEPKLWTNTKCRHQYLIEHRRISGTAHLHVQIRKEAIVFCRRGASAPVSVTLIVPRPKNVCFLANLNVQMCSTTNATMLYRY